MRGSRAPGGGVLRVGPRPPRSRRSGPLVAVGRRARPARWRPCAHTARGPGGSRRWRRRRPPPLGAPRPGPSGRRPRAGGHPWPMTARRLHRRGGVPRAGPPGRRRRGRGWSASPRRPAGRPPPAWPLPDRGPRPRRLGPGRGRPAQQGHGPGRLPRPAHDPAGRPEPVAGALPPRRAGRGRARSGRRRRRSRAGGGPGRAPRRCSGPPRPWCGQHRFGPATPRAPLDSGAPLLRRPVRHR